MAATSSKMAATSASSAPVPAELKISYGGLCYAADDGAWVTLPDANNSTQAKWNIVDLLFNYRLQFSQKIGKDSICTVTWAQGQYSVRSLNTTVENTLEMTITLTAAPAKIFDGTKADKARALPIANSDLKTIKLVLPWTYCKPKVQSAHVFRQWVSHFTHGGVSTLASTKEGDFCRTMLDVSLAESKAQDEMTAVGKGCRIKTRVWKRTVAVQVWPNADRDEVEQALGPQNFGMRYAIQDCQIFPKSEARAHKYPNQEGDAWELTIINGLDNFEAPLVGLMQNRFPNDLERFVGRTEDHVVLQPIIDDLLGTVTRKGLRTYAGLLDEFSARANGFLAPSLTPARLPLRSMWLKDPYSGEDNAMVSSFEVDPHWHGNDSQKAAVNMALTNKISLVWGPAATGKSETLARIIVDLLHNDKDEKILVNAPRNVPVDSLLWRVHSVWQSVRKGNGPFVRLYSRAQIEAQYEINSPLLKQVYHPDHIRLSKANANPKIWAAFLQGRQTIIQDGFIGDEKLSKAYGYQYSTLTKEMMAEARLVACTPALCGNSAFSSTDSKGDKVNWEPTTNVFDEAACANPLELLSPLVLFDTIKRAVYGGDHQQLSAFLASDEGRKHWRKAFFQDLVERRWPCIQLNVQYRTHSELADAANHVIYDNKVAPYWRTQDRSNNAPWFSFLNVLMGRLPIRFIHANREYTLNSYTNFINVSYGKEQGPSPGSKSNVEEANCVIAMIDGFRIAKMAPEAIAVITGYLAQFECLRGLLQEQQKKDQQENPRSLWGWNRVKLLTAGTVQAEEFSVVLVCLVKTQGSRGFVGEKRRANVVCTRAKYAMYFIGNWDFWTSENKSDLVWLDKILYRFRDQRAPKGTMGNGSSFLINGRLNTRSAPSSPSATRARAQAKATELRARIDEAIRVGQEEYEESVDRGAQRIREAEAVLRRIKASVQEDIDKVVEKAREREADLRRELENLDL
ncbi:MAG: hypothetical protein Q9170_001999 [Blastenia crenularia]